MTSSYPCRDAAPLRSNAERWTTMVTSAHFFFANTKFFWGLTQGTFSSVTVVVKTYWMGWDSCFAFRSLSEDILVIPNDINFVFLKTQTPKKTLRRNFHILSEITKFQQSSKKVVILGGWLKTFKTYQK